MRQELSFMPYPHNSWREVCPLKSTSFVNSVHGNGHFSGEKVHNGFQCRRRSEKTLLLGGGGLPYKNDAGARRKF